MAQPEAKRAARGNGKPASAEHAAAAETAAPANGAAGHQAKRSASVARKTKETDISVSPFLSLAGTDNDPGAALQPAWMSSEA